MRKERKTKHTFVRIISLLLIISVVIIMVSFIIRGVNRRHLINKVKEGKIFSSLSEEMENKKDKTDSEKTKKSSEKKISDGISLLTSEEVEKMLEEAGGLDEEKKLQENTYASSWKIKEGEDISRLFSCLEQNIEIKSVSEEKNNQIIVTAEVPNLGVWLADYVENTAFSASDKGMEKQIISDIESGICKKKEQQIVILLKPDGLNWRMELTEEGMDGLTGGFLTAIDKLTKEWNILAESEGEK